MDLRREPPDLEREPCELPRLALPVQSPATRELLERASRHQARRQYAAVPVPVTAFAALE
jgi:hypothetical protein